MAKYQIYKYENEIHVFGYDQSFDDEDIKSLWDEHRIIYVPGGIMAAWVEEVGKFNIVHLMAEDDGHLFWFKERDRGFNSHWLQNYIDTLTILKEKLNNPPNQP